MKGVRIDNKRHDCVYQRVPEGGGRRRLDDDSCVELGRQTVKTYIETGKGEEVMR